MNTPSLSFAEFMEKALYDLKQGYYGAGRVRIGKEGDFFTNVSVGKIYGHIMALFFQELWQKMGEPTPFLIVEQGANDGRLAHDILEAATSFDTGKNPFAKNLAYYIVEPFSIHQEQQQLLLKKFPQVSWVKSNSDLPLSFKGVHFSNELLDAFPVHVLVWNGTAWTEKRVLVKEESFSWVMAPLQDPELITAASQLPTTLAPGFQCEVRLGTKAWLQEIDSRLESGVILIADYGYTGLDRFAPYRAKGSIACYHEHQRYDNPLEEPGKRDISVHVDFTTLAKEALETGYELLGYSDQHHFLMGAAEAWLRSCEGKQDPITQHNLRFLRTLLHPETMGRQFKFLGLGKESASLSLLSGFRYQRPGLSYLLEN